MRGLIAITDHEWFNFLSRQPGLDEVNFWRPSDTRVPRLLTAGMPVIFKLRRKFGDWIVGYGIFARHDVQPVWLVWDSFEEKNGAATFAEMRSRIERLRGDQGAHRDASADYAIGCLMLVQPVFFSRAAWIRPPEDFPENSVQGKTYDLTFGEGARVWQDCLARGAEKRLVGASDGVAREESPRYGEPQLVAPRLGQGAFRLAVTSAYGAACAVTSEHSLPALEAAHIRPFADGGPHAVSNGLLLRSDIHRLFDRGYVGVTPEFRFVVSTRLKRDYSNGRTYYPLAEKVIQLPSMTADKPDPALLQWHMEHRFRG